MCKPIQPAAAACAASCWACGIFYGCSRQPGGYHMTDLRKDLPRIALAALVAQIPFELRNTFAGLSNLQWTFIGMILLSLPLLLNSWKELLRSRLVQAAALFVATQWFAACIAPEFHFNAFKGATRFSAGFLLL